jgi:3',5'-cyclic AMP phosphodiesterase CpdA
MVNILHISDLHFGTKDDANQWYEQLATDLRQDLKCNTLDALLISGDLTNRANSAEYEAARKFIVDLVIEFGLQWHHVVIVPGNHDLNWDVAKHAFQLVHLSDYQGSLDDSYLIDHGDFLEVPEREAYQKRFCNFKEFYENLLNRAYPLEPERQYSLHHFPHLDLLILGLNSAWQLDHHYTCRAGINNSALANALREVDANPIYRDSRLKIATWHHPLNSTEEDRIKDHGFMQQLSQHGFRLALHGHIHRARNENFQYRADRQIQVIAAGTFGAPVREWEPGYPLQYNLLKWEDNLLTVFTRKRPEPNGAWQPDAMWVQDGITALSYYKLKLWDDDVAQGRANSKQHKNPTPVDSVDPLPPSETGHYTPKKILVLAANPKGTSRLRLGEEVREIDAGLRRSQQRDQLILEQRWAVRPRDIQRAILDVTPQIIHFSGHGGGDEGLVFEDENGNVKFIQGEALANLFKLFSDRLECVILNGCYSEVQAEAIAQQIDWVIGMKQTIGDRAAIEFAVGFYDALGAGHSIEFAYQLGCASVGMTGSLDSLVPVLHKKKSSV